MIDSLIVKLLQQTFMRKMHQNTFDVRALPGPAGGAEAPDPLATIKGSYF